MRTSAIKVFGIMILTLVCIMLWTPSAQATVIFSDNFNGEGSGGLNYTAFANWTVTAGYVDVIPESGNPLHQFLPLSQGLYVDMDGSTIPYATAGTLTSNTLLGPGGYTLQFALAGSQRDADTNTVHVSLGTYGEDFTLNAGDPLTTYIRNVTVIGSSNLVFSQTNTPADKVGILLDDVSVSAPEPSTLLLFGAGLVGLGLIRKKFKN
jgi:hypothetical protein